MISYAANHILTPSNSSISKIKQALFNTAISVKSGINWISQNASLKQNPKKEKSLGNKKPDNHNISLTQNAEEP